MAKDEKKVSTPAEDEKKVSTPAEVRDAVNIVARYVSTGDPRPSWIIRFLKTGDVSTIPEYARKEFDATGKKITTYDGIDREITTPEPTPEARVALDCILDCRSTGNPVPDWAPKALSAARARVDSYESEWNDEFGRLLEKGKRRDAAQHRARWEQPVYERVRECSEAGEAIDDNLFERIGEELDCGGKTVIKEMYYHRKPIIEDAEEEKVVYNDAVKSTEQDFQED
jgi:hypothetical protein